MSDEELLAALESGRIEPGTFRHAEHVRSAWLYLQRYDPATALARYSGAIRNLALLNGASQKYHETITWAFVLLIAERLEGGESWEEFAERNPDLLEWSPSLLDRYYSPERLASSRARERFLWPDRAAI